MLRFTWFAAVIAAVLTLAGCRKPAEPGQPSGPLRGKAAGCNLLLISLDTTRADHLGCYGWSKAATPVLDSLARGGVRFTQAFTHVPITLPSHTCILTGTRPPENGVRDNGRFCLGPELPTLPALFKQHGYKTAAFVSAAVLNARYGLNRGFDSYDDAMPKDAGGKPFLDRHADTVASSALAWLDQNGTAPFMCWVHFFDPHAPYVPPAEYLAKTGHPYDGEIAFMDAHIGRLVEWLRAHGALEKTLIVVVGDHGEGLGDQGYNWHALLVYKATMHVPLIVSLPGRVSPNQIYGGPVCTSDIAPTVLELMGWDAPSEMTGTSLVPALRAEALPPRSIYGETDFPFYNFGWSKLRCLTDERWKYIRAPAIELYDHESDPGETRNVADAQPQIVRQMEEELSGIEQAMAVRQSAPVQMDAKTREALQSLGYVGTAAPATESANLKNPRDMLKIEHDFRQAESHFQNQKPQEAVALLEPAVQRSPESFSLVILLGRAYVAAHRSEDAQRTLMQAIALDPGSADAYAELATVLGIRGRFAQSEDAARKALELDPTHDKARGILSAATAAGQQMQAQLDAWRSQLRESPDSVDLALQLAKVLAMSGQTKEANAVFADAAARHPDNSLIAISWAWLLATAPQSEVRNGAEAVRLAESACAIGPPPAAHLATLAAAYAETGRFDQAVETARRAADLAKQGGDNNLAGAIERQIPLYQTHQPFHDLP